MENTSQCLLKGSLRKPLLRSSGANGLTSTSPLCEEARQRAPLSARRPEPSSEINPGIEKESGALVPVAIKQHQSQTYNCSCLSELIEEIYSASSTGSLTLNFFQGRISGMIEWKTTRK